MAEKKELKIHEKLFEIQQGLKAPKGQKNDFGNYNYRSAEDILTAVKPLLKKAKCVLTLSDTVINMGNRNYVEARVTLGFGIDSISVTASAREAETRKGMDDSQITGATSSYARKYALNGLFAIDDTKDADTMDNSKLGTNKKASKDLGIAPDNDVMARENKKKGEGKCEDCGADMKVSQAGKAYCSAICWENKS